MKKLLILLMAICLAVPCINAADLSKKDQKKVEKMAKERAKEYTKEGWKSMGTLPLQAALEKHLVAIQFDGLTEQSGNSTKTKSKNNGRMLAQSNAMNQYAGNWASQLKGRMVNDSKVNNDDVDPSEFEHFYAAFERLVESEIRGELQESYSLIRENADGTYEIMIMYLIDPKKALNARLAALESAKKESELAQKYSEQISNFINDGF